MAKLASQDPKVNNILKSEEQRQREVLSMIPSENYTSTAVREAVGSVFMHKYAEGNIGARYYEGNEYIDELEKLTKERAAKLFKIPNTWDVNVQALSGSNANLAVYLAVLNPGDTMMGMYLPDGGHLSHGWSYGGDQKDSELPFVKRAGEKKVNISAKLFNTVQYTTDPKTKLFDYDEIEKIAKKYSPKLIITGGTAYPRNIDYKRMRKIADSVGALYMADIAHEAGLVAAGVVDSPVGIADIVTMTTHKTLRCARGAIILASSEIIKKVNRAVLPGLQGGPFNNNIAGICVGLGEALKPEFKKYAEQILTNTRVLGEELTKLGFDLVSGGSDKHLLLIDMSNKGIFGKYTAKALNIAGIVVNMNTMPGETRPPSDPSAIRLGTPWITTRGMKEDEMKKIAELINQVVEEVKPWGDLEYPEYIMRASDSPVLKVVRAEVEDLTSKFPLDI